VPPPPQGDLSAFLRNLERVRDLGVELMLSAHGPAIERPRELVQDLIDHRLARERAILSLLGDAPVPVEQLLAQAYRTVKPELMRAARNNLLAHLHKLRDDRRAEEIDGGWRAADGRAGSSRP
jgi:hypothetical protein